MHPSGGLPWEAVVFCYPLALQASLLSHIPAISGKADTLRGCYHSQFQALTTTPARKEWSAGASPAMTADPTAPDKPAGAPALGEPSLPDT